MNNTILHKADTRGDANHGWLHSRHTFSFANYHNPDDAGVWIHQQAWFHLGKFDKGLSLDYTLKSKGNGAYVYLPIQTSDSNEKLKSFRRSKTYKESNFIHNFISLDNGYLYNNFDLKILKRR